MADTFRPRGPLDLEETRRAYLSAVSFEMSNGEFNQQGLFLQSKYLIRIHNII